MKILRTVGLTILMVILGLLLFPWFLRGLGYYVDSTGGEIGRLAAEKHDVTLCKRIIVYSHLFGPPTMSRRGECVYTYAELTKDPSACELLMPSSYGWDCLGQAEKPNSRQCWFDFGPTPPQVGRGNDVVTIPACASNPKSMQENRCCELAETLYVDKENNCDALKGPTVLHDQCLELMAKRDKNLVLCSQIQDDNVRSGCEVAVRALKQE